MALRLVRAGRAGERQQYSPDHGMVVMRGSNMPATNSRSARIGIEACGLLVVLLSAMPVSIRAGEQNDAGLIVGAIRWDAWYGASSVHKQVESTLGQQKYHFRLPWFAEVIASDHVRIDGDSQPIIDQEIEYAATAGLNYWAFVDYWDEMPSMMNAWRRYRAATDKRGISYCFVEEGERMDRIGTAGWPRLVEAFADPHYQKVLDGRPLLFLFATTKKLRKADWQQLGQLAVAAGGKPPYLVLMGWHPVDDAKEIAALGFDAVSAYARPGIYTMQPRPFAKVREQIREELWDVCARERIPTVTFASSGWDTRPRNERPPSWFPDLKATPDPTPTSEQPPLIDAVTATPDELSAHVRDAVVWTKAHGDLNPSRAIIIYGWNELDEGGWLMPTLGADGQPDDRRIQALGTALRSSHP
jgi:hypothetical protein